MKEILKMKTAAEMTAMMNTALNQNNIKVGIAMIVKLKSIGLTDEQIFRVMTPKAYNVFEKLSPRYMSAVLYDNEFSIN